MSDRPTHPANFDENEYARPNQSWSCGWATEGHACPLGPTRFGICRSAQECAPYLQGDTWICARTKANGGPCEEGPLPDGTCCRAISRCQPVRGLMSRRGVVSLCVMAASIGTALIMLAAPSRTRLISPGALIAQHRNAVDRCEDCHVAGDGQMSDWVDAAFDSQVAQKQSVLCLKCHRELGRDALHAHGQSTGSLDLLTLDQTESASDVNSLRVVAARSAFGQPTDVHAELACATCHKEHHGAIDLTTVTNHQCQVCHATTFPSFRDGHPELTNYSFGRRTQIYFDHRTHFGRHFPAGGDESRHACGDCHMPDVAGRYMLAKNFEQTCADCHARQIEDDTLPGMIVAAIPAVDVATLRAAGANIGQWPAIYPTHVEAAATLTPFQALIFPQRDGLQMASGRLAGVELDDLSAATPEQLQRAEAFIWAYKESLADFLEGGRSGLHEELATRFEGRLTKAQVKDLLGTVPLEGLATMQRQWLPDLVTEIEARRAGEPIPDPSNEPPVALSAKVGEVKQRDLRESRFLNSGWYLHSPSMSLRYRPTRHADPLMKTLLDLTVLAAAPDGQPPTSDTANDTHGTSLRKLYESLASPFAIGRCTKCHTVDSTASDRPRLNWRTYTPPLGQHTFTHFNHAPHVTLLHNEACSRCHNFSGGDHDGSSIIRPEFVTSDWQPNTSTDNFHSDFADMPKTNCAECHTKQSERDACTTCHNYHVR